MQKRTCCLIGHQDLQDYDTEKMNIVLEEKIKQLANKGVEFFVSSCRLGFEMIAALKVLQLGKKLIVIDPFEGFSFEREPYAEDSTFERFQDRLSFLQNKEPAKNWSKKDIEVYRGIKKNAMTITISTEKDNGMLLGQHITAINMSDHILTAFDERNFGSTYAAINFAKTQEKDITYINMESLLKDLKKICQEKSWETRKDHVYKYSVDFSPKEIKNFTTYFGLYRSANTEERNYDTSVVPKKEKSYELAKNIAFDLAEKTFSKISIIQFQDVASNVIELESDGLIFQDSRAKRLLVDLINMSDRFVFKPNENGNVSINAQFVLNN